MMTWIPTISPLALRDATKQEIYITRTCYYILHTCHYTSRTCHYTLRTWHYHVSLRLTHVSFHLTHVSLHLLTHVSLHLLTHVSLHLLTHVSFHLTHVSLHLTHVTLPRVITPPYTRDISFTGSGQRRLRHCECSRNAIKQSAVRYETCVEIAGSQEEIGGGDGLGGTRDYVSSEITVSR